MTVCMRVPHEARFVHCRSWVQNHARVYAHIKAVLCQSITAKGMMWMPTHDGHYGLPEAACGSNPEGKQPE